MVKFAPMVSEALKQIRNEAFLRALRKAALEQSGAITAASIAKTLDLAIPQLGFIVSSLVNDGFVTVHGDKGSECISFTDSGLSAATELANTHPQSGQE